MEKELLNTFDKELLLKDLSARLPYHTNLYSEYADDNWAILTPIVYSHTANCSPDEIGIKPYLFPLSSISEEQRNDISKLLIDTRKEYSPYGEINTKGCDNLFVCSVKQSNALIKYCLMHHLDINGLIEKGLAIDATGLNIY